MFTSEWHRRLVGNSHIDQQPIPKLIRQLTTIFSSCSFDAVLDTSLSYAPYIRVRGYFGGRNPYRRDYPGNDFVVSYPLSREVARTEHDLYQEIDWAFPHLVTEIARYLSRFVANEESSANRDMATWSNVDLGELQPLEEPSFTVLIKENKKAKELLLSYLDDDQKANYKNDKSFVVVGKSGTRYRINYKTQINIDVLNDHNEVVEKLCLVPDGKRMPIEDHQLAQMLMIRANEEAFLEKAIVHNKNSYLGYSALVNGRIETYFERVILG